MKKKIDNNFYLHNKKFITTGFLLSVNLRFFRLLHFLRSFEYATQMQPIFCSLVRVRYTTELWS